MTSPRMRPVFARTFAGSPEAFWDRLGESLRGEDGGVRGQTFDGGAILRLRHSDRHVWSPALYVHVEQDDAGRVLVRGRFSPSSPVWTAFVAIYLVLLCLAMAAGSYGGAQLILDEYPWAFWGVPLAVVLAAFTYGAAFIGQGLSSDDMYRLRAFVDAVVETAGDAG